MAEDPLADEEQVEQARDTMTAEALVAFFIAAAILSSDDDEGDGGAALGLSVAGWAIRGGQALWSLYIAGATKLGHITEDTPVRKPEEFEPSRRTITELTRGVKAMRKVLRENEALVEKGEPLGPHLTPDVASNAIANEAHGLLTMDMAEELGPNAMPGLTIHKTWVSRQDKRVRPLHAKLSGRTKPLGKDFWRWPQTGQVLAYPGDARAPMDAIAGCRCFLLLAAVTQ